MHSSLHSTDSSAIAASKILSMSYQPMASIERHPEPLPLSLHYQHFPQQNGYHHMHNISFPNNSQLSTPPAASALPLKDIQLHPQALSGYTPPQKLHRLSAAPVQLCVEACQTPLSTQRPSVLREHILSFLERSSGRFSLLPGCAEKISEFQDPLLDENLKFISVSVPEESSPLISRSSYPPEYPAAAGAPSIHVFQLYEGGPTYEDIDDEEVGANRQVASHWMLPSSELEEVWESLVLQPGLKASLVRYAKTLLLFSSRGVNSSVIACNRIILLYGPPGTGKTSLCRGLAQKLSIQLNAKFTHCQLVEINSHSLFSKWFSESGKLVQKMFDRVRDLAADRNALICILIDEVESLAAARSAFVSGSEPSDALRVVNAMLTQVDSLRTLPNVLIFCTSNITGAIDLAFIDRADIKQFIGNPSKDAIYRILQSCVQELMRLALVSPPQPLLEERALHLTGFVENEATALSLSLYRLAQGCEGISGRSLRKLPLLAFSSLLEEGRQGGTDTLSVGTAEFIQSLEMVARQQFKEKEELQANSCQLEAKCRGKLRADSC